MNENKEEKKKSNRFRDKMIPFWVTEKEKEVIEEKASFCKLSVSEYTRRMCVNGTIIKREFDGIGEINKIGVNINQIAKKVNEKGFMNEAEFEELRKQYDNLFELFYEKILNG